MKNIKEIEILIQQLKICIQHCDELIKDEPAQDTFSREQLNHLKKTYFELSATSKKCLQNNASPLNPASNKENELRLTLSNHLDELTDKFHKVEQNLTSLANLSVEPTLSPLANTTTILQQPLLATAREVPTSRGLILVMIGCLFISIGAAFGITFATEATKILDVNEVITFILSTVLTSVPLFGTVISVKNCMQEKTDEINMLEKYFTDFTKPEKATFGSTPIIANAIDANLAPQNISVVTASPEIQPVKADEFEHFQYSIDEVEAINKSNALSNPPRVTL